jgi:hypothetical protein
MAHVPDNLVSNTMASRQARGVVYVGLAFLAHCLIWAAIPAPFALALSSALVLVERLAGELTDTILGAVAARDEVASKLMDARPAAGFRDELKFELFGPSAAIALAVLAAVAGLLLKPWLAPGLQWLGA